MPAPEINIPALILPAHLRLGVTNWRDFKQAVETACRVAGVEDNLTRVWRAGQWSAKECDAWAERDELCKAIITLNIHEFHRYGVSAGKETTAQEVWAQLIQIHAPTRWVWLCRWVRPSTRLEWLLLGVVFCFFVLLLISAEESQKLRAVLAEAQVGCRFESPLAKRMFQDLVGDGRRLRYTGL
ncbi:hypothetical protein OH76DRAFT_1484102 [Lentinus brumalis]|uniref:Uncharacterized protein n=1 Tax=Lentinus brumalis TaxID=2498619 RepID=A0A371D6M5_9APHY|nr:hypothetical protein OH76DRAFT_1484102 [Polyporus brumalis]